ncbi:methyltransferase domain-containing protein [Campylobacter sp. RM16191]|uniref:class I SAM-dependent methyltransferase n=1 Tax=Campylobacter sp. RM16191 TaxID=1705728 RepID=UPI0014750E86|nr:methyltransferase domain-containing protein [Campylobacter sp. RM16191]
MTPTKPVLDVCCGPKMFYFNKQNDDVLFCDKRRETHMLCDGRTLEVNPDVIADFRNLPFSDESFYLVIFDPPHLKQVGDNSWLCKKYGKLAQDWQNDLKKGFDECMRVLKTNGTLIFKWNENQIKVSEVLKCFSKKPLLGQVRGQTHWLVFFKGNNNDTNTKNS